MPKYKDTWEELNMLNNCPLKLQEFRERFPNKPHDTRNVQKTGPAITLQEEATWQVLISLLVAFSGVGFLARRQVFNGHGMSCVGKQVLWNFIEDREYCYPMEDVGTFHYQLAELLLTHIRPKRARWDCVQLGTTASKQGVILWLRQETYA